MRRVHAKIVQTAFAPWLASIANWFERYGYTIFPHLLREDEVIRSFESLRVGDCASITIEITRARLVHFALASGDWNLMHFDEVFASETRFGEPIAHGFLVGSYISSVLSSKLPGQGTVYEAQEMSFKRPVFPGDTITATVTIVSLETERQRVILDTKVLNQDGILVIEGKATVRLMRSN